MKNKKLLIKKEKLPDLLIVLVLYISILPSLFCIYGVDFSISSYPFVSVVDSGSNFSSYQFTNLLHKSLAGSFIHTILEWSAVCAAFFTAIFAFTHYSIKRDITTPIIGIAFLCAAVLDGFHTFIADRLILVNSNYENLVPFSWAISRIFNSIIMVFGIGFLLLQKKIDEKKHKSRGLGFVLFIGFLYILIAGYIVCYSATANILPKTLYVEGLVNRPWDTVPLILYVFAGLYVCPQFYRKHPNLFSQSLTLSILPQILTQLHMVFGSSRLYDSHYNVAQYTKIIAYIIPFLGLMFDYTRTYLRLKIANLKLLEEIVEREKAEAAQRRYVSLLEATTDFVGFANKDKIPFFLNKSGRKLVGLNEDEDISKLTVLNFHPKWACEKLENEIIPQAIKNGAWLGELALLHKNGSEIPISMVVVSGKDKNGDVDYLATISRDITERIVNESELKRQKDILESIINNIGEGVVVSDEKGNFTIWNPGAKEIVGLGPEEIPKESWSQKYGVYLADGITPCPTDQIPLIRTLRGESVDSVRIFLKNENLTPGKFLTVTGRPIKDSKENVKGGVVVFRDETERIKAEEERSRVFNLSSDLLCIADFNGYFKQLNPMWEKTLGYSIEELLSKPYIEFVHPDDRNVTITEAINLTTGKNTLTFENRYLCKDGSIRWLQWNAVPYLDTGLIYANARDITERRKMEDALKIKTEELTNSNKELEQFAYVASHDLQEPLRMISSYTQLLSKKYKDKLDKDANEFIGFAVDGAKRMQQLINDLLEFSRVGTRGKSFESVDLNQILTKAISNLKLLIQENNVEIKYGTLPIINGDSIQLIQVFQNLISNSIKYRSKEQPVIEIIVNQDDGSWVISIKDNGIGIDPKYSKRIFEIFQRLHTREEYEGTGIGLAVCKKIIERHGGKIWVESELNKGCIFSFSIPV